MISVAKGSQLVQQLKFPLEAREVGGELLDVLSRGLYSDAKDVLREYAQNGIDAGATEIHIRVRGPVVTVRDDGSGMNIETLRKARRFGMSDKSPKRMVGFRGIGIYSAFGMCDETEIITKTKNTSQTLHLKFNFGAMREILENDRLAEQRLGVSLIDLINQFVTIHSEPYHNDDEASFTLVRMTGIGREFRAQLNDVDELSRYLINTLPVAYPQEDYGTTINVWLKEKLDLHPVPVYLQTGNELPKLIAPPAATNVTSPSEEWIMDEAGGRIAYVWYVLSSTGERIGGRQSSLDEMAGPSGFTLKSKGFTLGNRALLKPFWPPTGGRTLYHHYSGEVHILDNAGVYPNAARDDLEPSPEKQVLFTQLTDFFYQLYRRADLARAINSAQKKIEAFDLKLDEMNRSVGDLDKDPYEQYKEASVLVDEVDAAIRQMRRYDGQNAGRNSRQFVPPAELKNESKSAMSDLREMRAQASKILKSLEKKRKTPKRTTDANEPPTTQQALIREVVSQSRRLHENNPNTTEVTEATATIERFGTVGTLGPIVAALDDLKALGADLGGELESLRVKMRGMIGLSPSGPVSLRDALAVEGFAPATDREEKLLSAVDRGIIYGLGGRGQSYEAVIAATVSELTNNSDL